MDGYIGTKLLLKVMCELFNLSSKPELSKVIGVSQGTLSTWTTRNMLPTELMIRLHLVTGIDTAKLCYEQSATTNLEPVNFDSLRFPMDGPILLLSGKRLLDKLQEELNCADRVQLSDRIGVNPGTMSIWVTRNTIPHNVLFDLYATGIIALEPLVDNEVISHSSNIMSVNIDPFQVRLRTVIGGGLVDFSRLTQISTAEINRVLSGSQDPTVKMLKQIADAKNVSLDWLLLGVGEPQLSNVPEA